MAVPLGTAAALRRGRSVDQGARVVSLVGVSLPNFWLGPMLILLAAIEWRLFPVSGREEPLAVVLPAITLGTGLAGLLTRMVRTSLVEELGKPYLLTARAKGLSRATAVVRHAFKNALVPVVTVVGLQFGTLLTGAIITETIFAWPGPGRLLIDSIRLRDYPLLQGALLVIVVTYIAVNLVTDVAYAALDPRIRYESR